MKISEFTRLLEGSFSSFFGCEVKNEVYFDGGGEFTIHGYLNLDGDRYIVDNHKIGLYDIKIRITNDFNPKPKVDYAEFPFTGEISTDNLNYTLEESLVYIKEHLATIKSKTIYENL